MLAGALALALAAAPHLSTAELAKLRKDVPARLVGPLAPLGPRLQDARTGTTPTVAHVRARLNALRALESAARAIFARDPGSAATHQALALAWGELAELEGALAIEGEGEGPQRDAVRTMAQQAAENADALAADELARASSSRGDARAFAAHHASLSACWQEHLLRNGGEAALELRATLDRQATPPITFEPALQGPRAALGECLATRLLGWHFPGDDEAAIELPLHLTAPAK